MEKDCRTSKNTLRAQAACVTFYSKMKEYCHVEKYTDVSITCQDRVFRCHRLVLAAASDYFDAMFGGNFKESRAEDVVLHDISHSAFESVLHYMYTGMVPVIGDENVYDLLRTASMLNLPDIEEQCVHYLCESNVPINYAVEIYSLAYVIGNKRLISCASQCILKHLSHVSEDDLFLRMAFKELGTLLEFALPDGSSKTEHVLLNAICRWVSNQTCFQEEKESLFLKLTQNVCFRHIPVVFSHESREAVLQPDRDDVTDSDVEDLNPSLHVYLDLEYPNPNNPSPYYRPSPFIALFSLEKSDGNWRRSHEMVRSVEYMRTVVYDNQLYSFQLNSMFNAQFAFFASPSVDFSENVLSLTRPPLNPPCPHFSMCCQKNGIYACSIASKALLHYNLEQDEWFPISFSTKEEFSPALITMCHNQMYIMGSELNSAGANILRTYDDRTGKLEAASKSNWYKPCGSEVCTHRERIYVSDCTFNSAFVEVYDPVANKWDKILDKSYIDQEVYFSPGHRLASFENKLWMFTVIDSQCFTNGKRIHISHYDSYADEWNKINDYSLWNAVDNERFKLSRIDFIDAIVYKPPQ